MAKNTAMNEELRKWIAESKEEIKKTKKKREKYNKKPTGKCEICGQRFATNVCLKCGKSVCNSCFFNIIGVCKKCTPAEVASKWDGSRPDWEKELGVEWVG